MRWQKGYGSGNPGKPLRVILQRFLSVGTRWVPLGDYVFVGELSRRLIGQCGPNLRALGRRHETFRSRHVLGRRRGNPKVQWVGGDPLSSSAVELQVSVLEVLLRREVKSDVAL